MIQATVEVIQHVLLEQMEEVVSTEIEIVSTSDNTKCTDVPLIPNINNVSGTRVSLNLKSQNNLPSISSCVRLIDDVSKPPHKILDINSKIFSTSNPSLTLSPKYNQIVDVSASLLSERPSKIPMTESTVGYHLAFIDTYTFF